ncbi:hypothetical protein [Dactylosporangium sp. NPDC049140]|uniref:hypothetical protein n=1 Tax=Dactylosporangium sp. NPDC049140 TaxID=3155647 RepID=UPI0033C5AAE1
MTVNLGFWRYPGDMEDDQSEQAEQVRDWLLGPAEQWPPPTRQITFEPDVITVSAARRRALLRGAGWLPVNVQIMVSAFDNTPLGAHVCFLQYAGPRGETFTGRSELAGGTASYADFWLKPQGVLQLLAVPQADSPAAGGPVLAGSIVVPSRIAAAYLAFTAIQDHQDIEIRAGSQQAVAEQLELQGNVKFTILGTVEIGGGGGRQDTSTRTTTGEVAWTVRIARPGLTIAPAQR